MRGTLIFLFILITLPAPLLHAQRTEFSGPNALRVLRVIAGEIGPRPMGSPAERRAMEFALAEMRSSGCDSTFFLPIQVADRVNTATGVAVGVVKGATGRIIVLGAHIDSSGPDIPGANDDGSGSACVIELARVLARRETAHTLMFCLWGGEEEGLIGSRAFVREFKELDSIDLMIQLDMADGAGVLLVDPHGQQENAPPWLVRAAFEAAHGACGYDDVVYWVRDGVVNRAAGSPMGSDHSPFLDHGIPAIGFTSDVRHPIHTPLDDLSRFTASGLQRSGDIALTLVERFDGGIPSRSTARYLLLQSGSLLAFLPVWSLYGAVGVALLLALAGLFVLARRRPPADPARRGRWSGLKIFLFMLLIQTFAWQSETVAGLITGLRFPWVNNFAGYLVLGLLAGLLGLWVILQIARRFPLTADAFVFARVSLVLFGIATLGAALRAPEFGALVAAISALVTLSLVLRRTSLRIVLFAAAVLLAWALLFFESLELFQRALSASLQMRRTEGVVYESMFVAVYSLLTLPFAFAFAALYRDSGRDLLGLRSLQRPRTLAPILIALLLGFVVLVTRPSYDGQWQSIIRAEVTHRYGSDSIDLMLTGSESLGGLQLKLGGKDSAITDNIRQAELPTPVPFLLQWLEIDRSVRDDSAVSDSTVVVNRTIALHAALRPARVDVTYRGEKEFAIQSRWEFKDFGPTHRRFSWYWFPDTSLLLPVRLTVGRGDEVTEEIRVVFDSLAWPLRMTRDATTMEARTVITAVDTLRASPPARRSEF